MNYPNIEHFHYYFKETKEPRPNPFMDMIEAKILMSLCDSKAGNVLEIGPNKGVTTGNLAKIVKEKGGKVIAVDVSEPPTVMRGMQGKGECLPAHLIGSEIPAECKSTVEIHLINPNKKDSLKNLLEKLNIQFDVIFIDGNHAYEGVSLDYHTTLPFLKPEGVMTFHDVWWDTVPHPVEGPLLLLNNIGGFILNKTHLGMPKSQVKNLPV